MQSFKPYEIYKESNISWLGQVPAHWLIDRAKWSVQDCKNGFWGTEPEGEEDIVCVRVADFDRKSKTVSLDSLTLRNIAPKDRNARLLKEGDLLLEKSGGGDKQLVGAVVSFNHNFPAVTSNFVAKMSVDKSCNARFLTYIHSHFYDGFVNYRSIKQTTGIQNLDSQQYLDERMSYPPLEEQQKIADFLDFKAAQIDALIAKKEALLLKLQEKRSALITQAVTKGIHPNVGMKSSGVEWLGDVPAHWETFSLRHTLIEPLSNGLFKKKDQWGSGSRIVDVFDIYVDGDVIDESSLQRVDCSEFELEKYSALHGDFFFVRSSLKLDGIGKSALVSKPQEKMVFECHLVRGRPDLQKVDPKFYIYLLNSQYCRQILVALSNQVTMTTLDQEKFKGLKVPLPPKNEQEIITKYLDEKTSAIDKQLIRTEEVIFKLQEYRSSLITNTVTGKIDVRDFVVPNMPS